MGKLKKKCNIIIPTLEQYNSPKGAPLKARFLRPRRIGNQGKRIIKSTWLREHKPKKFKKIYLSILTYI